jgi:hypothetical protein
MTKLIAAFRNFANAPKKIHLLSRNSLGHGGKANSDVPISDVVKVSTCVAKIPLPSAEFQAHGTHRCQYSYTVI